MLYNLFPCMLPFYYYYYYYYSQFLPCMVYCTACRTYITSIHPPQLSILYSSIHIHFPSIFPFILSSYTCIHNPLCVFVLCVFIVLSLSFFVFLFSLSRLLSPLFPLWLLSSSVSLFSLSLFSISSPYSLFFPLSFSLPVFLPPLSTLHHYHLSSPHHPTMTIHQ